MPRVLLAAAALLAIAAVGVATCGAKRVGRPNPIPALSRGEKTMTTITVHDATAETVADDVVHVLGHSWFFDPQTIQVEIRDGKVTLRGTVKTERERKLAAACAWLEDGVADVENRLTVA